MSKFVFWPTVSRGEAGKYLEGTTDRVLLTASSYAAYDVRKYGKVRDKIPEPKLPDSVIYRAADCGGFVATFKWGGIYKYTPEQYVQWLDSWNPQWAATMDYCCEEEIISGKQNVRDRQDKTTENAYMFIERWIDKPYMWVPTIQGWTVEDYIRHATEMKPLIDFLKEYYGEKFLVGIGTLCHRASVIMIRLVVEEVCKVLDTNIHLWGVKKAIFASTIGMPKQVVSCDSAAFNGLWGKGRTLYHESGKSEVAYTLQDALPKYSKGLYRSVSYAKQHKKLWEL